MTSSPARTPLAARTALFALSSLSVFASLLLAACSGAPASYPDSKGIVAAQAEWCDMLQKIRKEPGDWSRLGECKSFYPTASAPYLKGMSKCFFERIQRDGDSAPDNTTIVDECNNEAVAYMEGDESSGAELIDSRCQRMERCEKVAVPECKAAIQKLESATRAEITTKFNRKSLHEVADCLSSASCTDDEDSARAACYKPANEKLLWFP
ncbi:MAG: hypothetical protein R3B70_27010 [Polyangiaceae bacterium]